MCNSNVYPNVSDNQIVIRVIIGVQYSAAQLSDNVYYVGAGVTFSSTRTWTGQIQLAVVKDIALLPPVNCRIIVKILRKKSLVYLLCDGNFFNRFSFALNVVHRIYFCDVKCGQCKDFKQLMKPFLPCL